MTLQTNLYTSFKLASWNARNIRNQREELIEFLQDYEIDAILVQETQLKPSEKLTIPNYHVYREDRDGRGGGLAIIIKRTHNFTILGTPDTQNIETIRGQVQIKEKTIIIASVYRPPHKDLLDEDLNTLFVMGKHPIIAAGDYNAKHPSWHSTKTNANGRKLFTYTQRNNINVHGPIQHTHHTEYQPYSSDVLDICLTKNYEEHIDIETKDELSSDHLPIVITLDLNNPKLPLNPPKSFINWPHFLHLLQNTTQPIPIIETTLHLEEAVTKITKDIKNAINTSTVTKTSNHSHQQAKLPTHIKQVIRQKNQTLRRARSTKNPAIKQEANQLTERVKDEIKQHKSQLWNDKLISLSKGNPNLHKLCRILKTTKDKQIPPIHGNYGIVYTKEDKTNAFANTLQQQFILNKSPEDDIDWEEAIERQSYRIRRRNPEIQLQPATPQEIKDIIKNLKPNKATGNDDIPNNALKSLPKKRIVEITNIINAMLRLRYFPKQWKKAIVIVLPKPGKSRTFPQNYRPISLLPSIGKVAEKLILTRLNEKTENLQTIPDSQFGFRSQHSTTLQAARLAEYIIKGLNRRKYTSIIALDVEKAFDRVWHEGLLVKMSQLGYSISITQLIGSFLEKRTFQVKIEDIRSEAKNIEAGVPQGSPLSPILYNIYTSDIPLNEKTLLSVYADDTAIATQSKSIQYTKNILQRHYQDIANWFLLWKIKVNIDKTQLICITRKRTKPRAPMTLNNTRIRWQRNIKYLGLHLDSGFTWQYHINTQRNKAIGAMVKLYPMLCRNSPLSIDNKLLIYKSYIRPILTYGASVWGNTSNTHLKKLQTVQNKILRLCINAPWYVRNTVIHRDLNIPFIHDIVNEEETKINTITETHPNQTLRHTFAYNPAQAAGRYRRIKHLR